jgi:UDP-glucose 4-epimerase
MAIIQRKFNRGMVGPMILVTGGSGFLGLHATRALVDAGEQCVITRFNTGRMAPFLAEEVGRTVTVEQLDATDPAAIDALLEAYPCEVILHMVSGGLAAQPATEEVYTHISSLAALIESAAKHGTRRIVFASSIGVYRRVMGAGVGLTEDTPLPLVSPRAVEAFKKAGEVLGSFFSARADIEFVAARIGLTWGPSYKATTAAPPVRLIKAALNGEDSIPGATIYLADGQDLGYGPDVGQGLALLATAPKKLEHPAYNVANGRMYTNQQVLDTVRAECGMPDEWAPKGVAEGHEPNVPPGVDWLDVSLISNELGYKARFDLAAQVADYAEWVKRNESW